jgi:ABC-2 type transport system ATP-binding protein
MQQKVQFIGALLHEPELVILDEPFSGLDPVNAQALKDTVVDIRQQGRTVVLSTHVMDNAERMCDAVCIISGGVKVLDGSVSDVRAERATNIASVVFEVAPDNGVLAVLNDRSLVHHVNDGHRSAEVELTSGADPQELLARLVGAGARLERFELVRPSLHRIFLEKVGAHEVETGMSGHG